MASNASGRCVEDIILLFGPQTPLLARSELSKLWAVVNTEPKLAFLLETINALPSLWTSTVLSNCPGFRRLTSADENLKRLVQFFDIGDPDVLSIKPPCEFALVILTVISQIAELISLPRTRNVQGFCVGFLAAAAVASSHTDADLERWAATALRLAVCVGAVVDIDELEQSGNPSSTWSLRWTTDTEEELFRHTLASFPEAYVSCMTDVNRATFTLPENDFPALAKGLADGRLSAQRVGISGRYHTIVSGRQELVQQLKSMCQHNDLFQYPSASELASPLRSTSDAQVITHGLLHEIALDCILMSPCRWYDTVRSAVNARDSRIKYVLPIGHSSATVPRSLKLAIAAHEPLTLKVTSSAINGDINTLPQSAPSTTTDCTFSSFQPTPEEPLSPGPNVSSMPIAVIGMACRFAQADSLEQFWSLINSDTNACTPVPEARFKCGELWRKPKGPFFGNFLEDADAFDHRFFNMSAREAESMDPQQRLLLQVSYEAMESAGYSNDAETPQRPVGCYVGAGYVEYEDNVASDHATAYSATGTIRAFVSGKISHHFGWTGPSIVFDTACSSSAVAIHHACKALQTNDCSVAVAGGVSMITSPTFYQNLAAASFLSPSGASKAFDADADGYCRGEGAGMLVLKPLDRAMVDGDRIIGTIVGSAVNQNSSCTPITVPDSSSQSDLYLRALAGGGIPPSDVTYVEAHGTGTPVGDPIECASIRTAFGDCDRSREIVLGSVKDVIGHTESASGVAGIIKTLLMMQHGIIPKQPNFRRLNPKIPALSPDKLAIADRTRPWPSLRRTALVNNYGAAGSNAAIVLQEHLVEQTSETLPGADPDHGVHDYPILLSAKNAESLKAYAVALKSFLIEHESLTLADISYNLARTQNRAFEFTSSWNTASRTTLQWELEEVAKGTRTIVQRSGSGKWRASPPPVVLCFGGQTGRRIYLSRHVYNSSPLLRTNLDRCDDVCKSLGLPLIFPRIFDAAPVDDLVALHAMLFSVQYASAIAWIQSGVPVTAVVGHSFGQLTALCVAGSMSLSDGFRLVTGRARLIEEQWGDDHGVMLAAEGGPEDLCRLSSYLKEGYLEGVDITCYNGPRNVVFGGGANEIDEFQKVCDDLGNIKTVRLANSHAYHTSLTDPILNAYKTIAESIDYRSPSTHVETCSPGQSWTDVDASKVVQHTREPVYFDEAIQRLSDKYPACIWLEAGSASPIASMVRRAIPADRTGDVLLPLDLGKASPWSSISKTTCALWTAGLKTDYWPFSGTQGHQYPLLHLPPYQFAKSRHWIRYRPYGPQEAKDPEPETAPAPPELLRRVVDGENQSTFVIDPTHEVYNLSVRGHAVVDQSLCPAGLYFELAIRAAKLSYGTEVDGETRVPHIGDLKISAPLGLTPDKNLYLELSRTITLEHETKWTFLFFTGPEATAPVTVRTIHGSGSVSLCDPEMLSSRFRSYGRLMKYQHLDKISASSYTERLSGNILYRVFSRVVKYASYYKGVQDVTANEGEVVGTITMPSSDEANRLAGTSRPLVTDNFLQIAGIHANCLQVEASDDHVWVCNAIGEVLWSETFLSSRDTRSWKIYSNMELESETTATNDIFVLDTATNAVVVALLGAKFHQVGLASLLRVLSKLGEDAGSVKSVEAPESTAARRVVLEKANGQPPQDDSNDANSKEQQTPKSSQQSGGSHSTAETYNVALDLCRMLGDIFGMSVDEVDLKADLADLGVDSLMITEISGEIQKLFGVTLAVSDLQELTDVQSLVQKIEGPSPTTASSAPPPQPTIAQSVRLECETESDTVEGANEVTGGHRELDEHDGGVAAIAREWYAMNRNTFDEVIRESGFSNFRKDVYPLQAKLVTAYIVEAFASMGCDLRQLHTGEPLPELDCHPKHSHLMTQLREILEDANLIDKSAIQTSSSIPAATSQELHDAIVLKFPRYAAEHQLLRTTGARLADCLTGQAEPLSLMFGSAESRHLMGEVYTNGPMFKAATLYLSKLIMNLCDRFDGKRKVRILELGAGTGGTTNSLVQQLEKSNLGNKAQYTFSDISGSLVAAARKRFSGYSFVKYAIINVEKYPADEELGKYDVIISTNCIHATANLERSCANIKNMLREDGLCCLVEHTRNLYWFDLVWGLLDGWWLFQDGRTHALASETRWNDVLRASGFSWVDWSDGNTRESQILRVIVASRFAPASSPTPAVLEPDSSPVTQETVVFKDAGSLPLEADIFYPSTVLTGSRPRPVALMIHGGGHVMLSRKDIRPKQTQMLLSAGFLPVSIDYRLCPETTLVEGPMTDVTDALKWARETLPHTALKRNDICITGEYVVAVGWSTGGTLAMSLGWMAPARGLRPPEAILALYCPTDYEDECWTRENKPFGETTLEANAYDVHEGVADSPIVAYNPPTATRTAGGWMSKSDPRSRIVLHMNWHAQTLPILLHGLKDKKKRAARSGTELLPQPSLAEVQTISPLAHIRNGSYKTPTFLVHPTEDDLIPYEQSERTISELRSRGVTAEIRVVKDAGHLFDMHPRYERNQEAKAAVEGGYAFLARFVEEG